MISCTLADGIIFLTINNLRLKVGRATLQLEITVPNSIEKLVFMVFRIWTQNITATPASTHQPPRNLGSQALTPEAISPQLSALFYSAGHTELALSKNASRLLPLSS